jgi:polyferredoxin
VMLILGAAALFLLLSRKMNKGFKMTLLFISTFLFGIAGNLPVKFFSSFSMHPSPICSVAKAMLYGFRIPMIVTLAVILFLTLIGPKLFCGYVCPVGALQELIAMWADKMKIKRIRWNFRISNTVRIGIFLLFVFLSGTAILHVFLNGQKIALTFYDYINAFHGFEFGLQKTFLDTVFHFLPFILTIALAFKLYRPFCYLICPIGLFTNMMEHIALFRVRLKRPPCDDCGACAIKAPCPTVPDILRGSNLRPDCFACDVCVKSCPKNALDYGTKNTIQG